MGSTQLLDPLVDCIVVALCADYKRRAHAISERSVSHKVEMEYKYLNYKMLAAAAEIVGDESAENLIVEIGDRIGYAKSSDPEGCERTYKIRKKAVKHNIARKLWLSD